MGFCIITVLVIFFSGCSAKGEEVFDTFLLVARNLIQVRSSLYDCDQPSATLMQARSTSLAD